MNVRDAKALRKAPLETPTDLGSNAVRDISGALNVLLADMFALYVKTKNFHWHVSGPHFREYSERPTTSPSGYARSAVRPCVQSAKSAAASVFSTTTRTMSRRWIWWPSSATTTNS